MSYEVEAFREDADDLTGKLLAVALAQTEGYASVDRSIIVAAALANVACTLDGGVLFDPSGVTGRLSSIFKDRK